jgi:hypothetical protein
VREKKLGLIIFFIIQILCVWMLPAAPDPT